MAASRVGLGRGRGLDAMVSVIRRERGRQLCEREVAAPRRPPPRTGGGDTISSVVQGRGLPERIPSIPGHSSVNPVNVSVSVSKC